MIEERKTCLFCGMKINIGEESISSVRRSPIHREHTLCVDALKSFLSFKERRIKELEEQTTLYVRQIQVLTEEFEFDKNAWKEYQKFKGGNTQ